MGSHERVQQLPTLWLRAIPLECQFRRHLVAVRAQIKVDEAAGLLGRTDQAVFMSSDVVVVCDFGNWGVRKSTLALDHRGELSSGLVEPARTETGAVARCVAVAHHQRKVEVAESIDVVEEMH